MIKEYGDALWAIERVFINELLEILRRRIALNEKQNKMEVVAELTSLYKEVLEMPTPNGRNEERENPPSQPPVAG